MFKQSLFSLVIFVSGCVQIPIDTQPATYPLPKDSSPAALPASHQPVFRYTSVIVNFIGNVTAKKANALTAYIHQEMNKGIRHFTININSNGGETDAGISAYQYLKSLPVHITTHNIGSVQSSATMIYCAGTQRYSLAHSIFMLHGSATTYGGGMSLNTIESLLKLNKMRLKTFTDIFKECSQLSNQTMADYFSSAAAHYLSAVEAKEIGLVNEMGAPPLEKAVFIYTISD